MRRILSVKLLLLGLMASMLLAGVAGGQTVSDTDWTNASAAQIHEHMWQSKSRALMDRRYAEATISQSALANTQTNYDVLHYNIFIRVNDTTQVIYGRVKMLAKATQANVTQVQVDLYDNLTLDSIMSPSGNLTFTRLSNVVTVNLDHAYATNEQFNFTIVYHGHPIEGGFQAFAFSTRVSGKVISSLSEPYFARTWWPCKDRNDDKADSLRAAIEVDSSFYVGSNGSLDSVKSTSTNTKTYYYTEHYPIVTYLFSVAISKYTVWHDNYIYNAGKDTMLITHAVYPDKYTYSLTHFNVTPQALALLSQTFGPYPFLTEKYGHSNFEWGGGMEHQTMTSMTSTSFGFSEPVVVHEMTHQWTGDMITCKTWGHIWLNEGFASYGEAVYYLNRDGWDAYHNYMTGMEYSGGGTIYISDTTSVGNIFGSIVYDKGAWVVHMLRGILKETKFKAAIDAYMNSQYRHGFATTEEFRDVVENATGVDLDWFFQEWIYGKYRPNYQYSYFSEPAAGGGWTTYLYVTQVQTTDPTVFKMPIDFSRDYSFGFPDTVTVINDQRRQIFAVHSRDSVTIAKLDPTAWILKYAMEVSWGLKIITNAGDVSEAEQFKSYRDTIVQKGATGSLDVTIPYGSLPPGLTINAAGVISGKPTDTGTFNFTVKIRDMDNGYNDQMPYSIHVKPTVLKPGDVNLSGGPVDLPDLSLLIAYMIEPGVTIPTGRTADVNNDCIVDLTDLSTLIAYLVGNGATMVLGCAP